MPVFLDQKHTKGPTNPVDEIDRARRKASRNSLAAPAQRRLEPACLSEKVVNDFFSINYVVGPEKQYNIFILQNITVKMPAFSDQKHTKGATNRSMKSTGRGARRAAIYLRRPRNGAWSRRAFLKKS
jgi:hypothetical protein